MVDLDGGICYAIVDTESNDSEVIRALILKEAGRENNISRAYVVKFYTDEEKIKSDLENAVFESNKPKMKEMITSKLTDEELRFIYFR